MTATTAPAFTHSADCDALTIGRMVQQLHAIALTEQPAPVEDALTVLEYVISAAHDGPRVCDCGKRALLHAEDQLRLARKRQRAFNADARLYGADYTVSRAAELAADVDRLIIERAAIRNATGR